MTDALVNLLRACQAAGVPATAEDVVDAAWLARWMTPVPTGPKPDADTPQPEESGRKGPEIEPPAPGSVEPLPLDEEAGPPENLAEPPLELPPEPTPEPDPGGESVGVYLPSGAKQSGAAGRVFRAPGAPALPRALEIARALRPLCRRVASRTRFVLDEAETIRRFAEEQICDPAMRPASERWLRLSLVIDTGTGSDLWREAAREFRTLLTCLGAFRDVRTWSLDTGRSPPRLTPGTGSGGVARKPKELIDAGGRTLTVVLSPCIASGWHDGSVAAVLGEWAARGPVVLVQLLPEYLWPRTALAGATGVQITTPAAGAANRWLKLTRPDAWPGEETPEGVAMPVAVLEPASLRRWAGLVAGRSGAEAPGFVLDTEPTSAPTDAPSDLSPAKQVEQFRQTSSPLARRLAGLLAAAPVVNLPIIRLVREALLPQAGQPQEAEVLFGGLLTRVPDSDANDPRFEFLPGAREALLDALPTDESVPVLEAVSDYLGEHLASGRTFRAVLADPTSAVGELVADASPFARIAAEVLLRAGGDYARLVSRKGKKVAAAPPEPAGHAGTETAAQPLAGDAEESFPRPFGKYRLLSQLSDGPASSVYLAQNTLAHVGHRVVLKMPRTGAACTPDVRAALQKESEILARLAELQSPNVCHIFDTGEIDGCPYFTMEYVPGETLHSYWAREGSRDGPWEALNLVHSLAVALARIHAVTLNGEPILHRNITPQNILIAIRESEPRFVLLDFGPRLAGNTASAGTELGYASPEELVPGWRGYTVTERSDVYSLGAILYQLLTAAYPLVGNSEELLVAVLNDAIRPPSAFDPALAPFNELCFRALARHPDDRYQSMRAFADAIIATYREHGELESPEVEAETDLLSSFPVESRKQLPDAADDLAEMEQFQDIAEELRSHARDPEATDADLPPSDDKTDSDWPAGVARAELEALNAIATDSVSYPKQATWRRSLPLDRPVKLGRDQEFADWAVPEDRLISRLHAILEWNGTVLTVTRRRAQHPNFLNPPANQIWFHNKPVEQCTVKPGEWFVIGRTQFTLHLALNEVEVTTDATTAYLPEVLNAAFGSQVDADTALRAIERLQHAIHQNPNEALAFWQMLLTAVMEALPRTETASVIHVPKGDQETRRSLLDRISTLKSISRPSQSRRLRAPLLNGDLVHNAVNIHRRSQSHLSPFQYLTAGFEDPEADWAICTPFPGGSRYVLYLAGEVNHEWNLPGDQSNESRVKECLSQYQKVTELLVRLIEVARRRLRLQQQQQKLLISLPQSLRKPAENPEELEQLLIPREQEITTLFCNLQDYAGYAPGPLGLLEAQREVSGALNARATVIVDHWGMVVGQHGEALLGFWGWPTSQPNQVEIAANAAIRMQSQTSPGLRSRQLGLGLTYGPAVVGRLNPQDVAAVDVFGPSVDLAARLGELAQLFGGGIVMDESAASLLETDPDSDGWRVRRLGRVHLPGFLAVNIYDLNWSFGGVAPDRYRELLTLWHEAVEFFTGGNWRQAREAFEADFADDPVARYLLRVMDRTDGKPPDDWNGTFVP